MLGISGSDITMLTSLLPPPLFIPTQEWSNMCHNLEFDPLGMVETEVATGSHCSSSALSRSAIIIKLKAEFPNLVLAHLPSSVQHTIRCNKEIVHVGEFRDVKSAIEKQTLHIIRDLYSGEEPPPITFFREVIEVLAEVYPYMYESDPMFEAIPGHVLRRFTARGTGGPGGLKGLDKVLRQAFMRLMHPGSDPSPIPSMSCSTKAMRDLGRKGRRPQMHGVDQDRYFAAATEAKDVFLESVGRCQNYAERENVFSASRETVQVELIITTNGRKWGPSEGKSHLFLFAS